MNIVMRRSCYLISANIKLEKPLYKNPGRNRSLLHPLLTNTMASFISKRKKIFTRPRKKWIIRLFLTTVSESVFTRTTMKGLTVTSFWRGLAIWLLNKWKTTLISLEKWWMSRSLKIKMDRLWTTAICHLMIKKAEINVWTSVRRRQ